MKYKQIQTQSGKIRVSDLVIGSAVKMGGLTKEELFRLYDRYLDGGGNCIDTARAYGAGRAEELVGEYLRERGNRNRLYISTKGGHPAEDGRGRLGKDEIFADLDASLKTLGTDYIDIYWLHKDDESYPVEKVIDTVNAVLKTGKAGAVGCSNWHIDRIARANQYARESGQQGFALSQIQWSLASTKEEFFRQFTTVIMDDVSYQWYLENSMSIFSFSPQAQGFFSKAAAGGLDSLNRMLANSYINPENLKRLERVKKIAMERNVPVSVPVLAYLINNKLPSVAVFGATSMKMLEETLLAADFEMTPEEADALYRVEGEAL